MSIREGWEIREALMEVLMGHGGSMSGVELSEDMFKRFKIRMSTRDVGRYMGVAKRKGWVRNDRIGYGPAQYSLTGVWRPGLDMPKPRIHVEHVKRTAFTEASDDMLVILLRTTKDDALRQAKAEAKRRGLEADRT